MAEGWIKLHRSIQESWIWNDEPFTKGQAWVDLILLANHEDKKVPFKGEIVICKRGTVNRSVMSLAERWKWSRKKVSNFLKILEFDGMVTTKCTTKGTTITLVNYDKFQIRVATEGTTEGTTKEQRRNINKNEKNDKKIIYKPTFNTFEKQNYDFEEIENNLGIK